MAAVSIEVMVDAINLFIGIALFAIGYNFTSKTLSNDSEQTISMAQGRKGQIGITVATIASTLLFLAMHEFVIMSRDLKLYSFDGIIGGLQLSFNNLFLATEGIFILSIVIAGFSLKRLKNNITIGRIEKAEVENVVMEEENVEELEKLKQKLSGGNNEISKNDSQQTQLEIKDVGQNENKPPWVIREEKAERK